MKTRKEIAKELGCTKSTIDNYVHALKLSSVKIGRSYCYSEPQIERIKNYQQLKKKQRGDERKKKEPSTCRRGDCRFRGDCLLTEKIYQTNCQDYEKEDFSAWLAKDDLIGEI